MSDDYVIKDSGVRKEFDSGMRRDTDEGKPRYDLIDKEGLRRVAMHMARGSAKYGERNWELASTEEEARRFQASGFRHFMQWLNGEDDEDHMAAVVFNLFAAERTYKRARDQSAPPYTPDLWSKLVD